jgi:hypothetical protein
MEANEYISYEQFGRNFFEIAVTEERVAAAFAAIAGEEFEMGPMRQGPGGLAKVTAKVTIAQPKAHRVLGDTITFDIRIPLAIDMVIDLRLDKPRFNVAGEIRLRAVAYASEPLLLILDVDKPRSADITINVESMSLRAELVRIIGGVDAEVKRFIAQYVREQIDSPASKKAQVIDVAERLDEAWTGV